MSRVHCKSGKPFDVYCGRPSPFGNPFVIGKDGTRDEVIARYREWLPTQPNLMAEVHTLHGKTLACWCFPHQACHCDVLLEFAAKAHTDLNPPTP